MPQWLSPLNSKIIHWNIIWFCNANGGHPSLILGKGAEMIAKYTYHDDVIKWKHLKRYWPFVRWIHRSPVNSPHKGQWRGALLFSLICTRINGWVNNDEAGDLRRHSAHYDVTVIHFSNASPVCIQVPVQYALSYYRLNIYCQRIDTWTNGRHFAKTNNLTKLKYFQMIFSNERNGFLFQMSLNLVSAGNSWEMSALI